MFVIDTSWLVALFNPSDTHHAKATGQATAATGLLLSGPVLTEFLNLVTFRLARQAGEATAQREVRAVLRSILDNRAFDVLAAYDAKAANELFMQHPALDYADAVAASMAQRLDCALFSFDSAQFKAIGRRRGS